MTNRAEPDANCGALLGVEREAQVVHRRRDVVTGEALLVARHRLHA